MIQKTELRRQIREKTKKLPLSYKLKESERIGKLLIDTPEFIRAESIFIYMSSPDEPETRCIIKKALESGKQVYVPLCVSKGEMKLVKTDKNTVFRNGYMGIREPVSYKETAHDADLAIIPCLSADINGNRLGHGAGFYDRFLKNSKAKKICLCFPALISSTIPTEIHDIVMDKVIY